MGKGLWVKRSTLGVLSTMTTPLSLTTIIVNLKIPKYSNKNSTLPPSSQNSLQHIGEFQDSLKLLPRTSLRAGK